MQPMTNTHAAKKLSEQKRDFNKRRTLILKKLC